MELNTFERMYADELYEAVDRAEQGSDTQITKAGKPVAWIIPITEKPGSYPADEVLAGLARIAKAAGIYEQALPATSLKQVCDMLAAWCRDRRAGASALTQITVSSRPDRPRVVATHPDDGTYWVKEIAFPEGQAVTLAEIIAEFEDSNHLPRKASPDGTSEEFRQASVEFMDRNDELLRRLAKPEEL